MFLQLGTVVGTVVGTVRALYGHCAGTVAWEIIGNAGNRNHRTNRLSQEAIVRISTCRIPSLHSEGSFTGGNLEAGFGSCFKKAFAGLLAQMFYHSF